MNENRIQFRVGLFVIMSLVLIVVMVFQFGEVKSYWNSSYPIVIHLDSAPGVFPSTSVKRNGIAIGEVREVTFDERFGGVLVHVDILDKHRLREDIGAELSQSLLGSATINILPGASVKALQPGSRIEGHAQESPLAAVKRLESQVNVSLAAFTATSEEWKNVGTNLNQLMTTNQGNLHEVLERTVASLNEFQKTMQAAGKTLNSTSAVMNHASSILGNPEHQKNLQATMAALPKLVKETEATISAARQAVVKIDQNLGNLKDVTDPIAKRSQIMVARLENSLINLEGVTGDVRKFTQAVTKNDGTLQRLMTDPTLYQNLNNSATAMSMLMKNLQPILRDVNIFSDKIARHPEVLGVRGAMQGSSGIKEASEIQPAGGFPKR